MTFVRKIVDDLVEKRLWPVALLLLVLLVAVPVVLGGGGDGADDAPPAASAGADDALGLQAAVVAEPAPATRQDRDGKLRDPFEKLYKAESDTATSTSAAAEAAVEAVTAAASASGAASGSSASSGAPDVTPSGSSGTAGGGTGTSRSTGSTGSSGATRPSTGSGSEPRLYAARADISFGPQGRNASLKRDVSRLKVLPSDRRRYVLYMGTLDDFKTAVFLLAGNVTSDGGEGRCRPRTGKCESIELKQGEGARLTVTLPDGTEQGWTLKVRDIDLVRVKEASTAKVRTSQVGRRALQKARAVARAIGHVTQADAYAWDAERRALRRQDPKKVLAAAQRRIAKDAARP